MNNTPVDDRARQTGTAVVAVLVTFSLVGLLFREPLYRAIAGAAEDSPSNVHHVVDAVAGKGLLVLVAITAVVTIFAWRHGRERFVLAVAAGVGTIAAYAGSEVLKLLVTEKRPCRTIGIDTVSACPEPGDWSWPSNHATIAFALATACVMLAPRLWLLAATLAGSIALARVAAGVHYVHDVASGAALGLLVTVTVATIAHTMLGRSVRTRVGSPR